jgi:hypothetical protein
MDLQLERKYRPEAGEMSYYKEIGALARAILETEDLQIATGELIEREGGALMQVTRSARDC